MPSSFCAVIVLILSSACVWAPSRRWFTAGPRWFLYVDVVAAARRSPHAGVSPSRLFFTFPRFAPP
ncbi:MAG: hypothetical protein ABF306_01920, partial [Nocardioides marinisabuli]|uniref:hypothetical protein n=1 Tax=Nocardioides marinisabuli TaxID=419476 RepID=UPI00321A79B1